MMGNDKFSGDKLRQHKFQHHGPYETKNMKDILTTLAIFKYLQPSLGRGFKQFH